MVDRPLKVAWFSFFPLEWLSDVPDYVAGLPRGHPATWQQVLLSELENDPRFELHILVLRREFDRDRQFKRKGVSFYLLKTRGGWRAASLFWHDTWLIRQVLRRVQPDVIHAWGSENGAALVATRLGYPALVTMQGLLAWLSTLTPLARYQRLMAILEKTSLRRARTATAESSFAVQYLRQHYPHLDVRQIEHAPRWLFHHVRRRPQTSPLRFMFVGALTPLKGIDLLLGALERLKSDVPFELTIVSGDTPETLSRLHPELSAKLWPHLRFKQSLTANQLAEELATANLLLCPSRADNSPNTVKEAVVAGVPVVASAIGGIVDYVFPGQNGLLFPAGDLDALAEAIRTAARHPLFAKGLVAQETLAQVRAYLSPELMGRRFAEAYLSLAQSAPTGRPAPPQSG